MSLALLVAWMWSATIQMPKHHAYPPNVGIFIGGQYAVESYGSSYKHGNIYHPCVPLADGALCNPWNQH